MADARNAPLFLLSPAPAGGRGQEKKVAGLYPAGLQTLSEHNVRLDSGIDLIAPSNIVVPAKAVVKVDHQVRAVCLRRFHGPPAAPGAVRTPWAYSLLSRSSISKTPLILANSVGIIDQGYRGPLIAAVYNWSDEDYTIEAGTALFQLVSADLAPPEYEVLPPDDPRTEEYFGKDATLRGAGGFGSTGAAGSAGGAPKNDI